jgi:murein DD-endopeptidase MepM/ murein hydrolase activator NlpD
MLISETTAEPRSIRVPSWTLRAVAVVLAAIVILGAMGALSYLQLSGKASLAEDLQNENKILRNYTGRVHQLETDLKTNRLLLDRMMELAGISSGVDTSGALQSGARDVATGAGQVGARPTWEHSHRVNDTIPRTTPYGLPMLGTFSRGFAPDESLGARRHFGIDIAAKEGTPVFATADGTVEFADWDETFGYYLIVDHLEGFKTYFGHNRALLVSVGETVKRGELVALSGNTGRSTAPHLHYEIRLMGEPVDPEEYMEISKLEQME